MKHFMLIVIAFFISKSVFGQPEPSDSISYGELFSMDMEELLNLKIAVASKSDLTLRESPGIISVITNDEIMRSGARDLIDVLRFIPGFEFGVDVEGVVDATVRGNWAHEGKLLLLIDGQEANELAYSTLQLGNHYPVEQIKRIEIIRGPGSAIYGGFAEMGVINVITKQAEDINGISLGLTYGQMKETFGRRNVHLSVGKKFEDVKFLLHGFAGQGNRSDRENVDIYGNTFDMAGSSDLNPGYLNTALSYKRLHTRFIYDKYSTSSRDIFGENLLRDYKVDFISALGEIKYDLKVNDKVQITPKLNYKRTKSYYAYQEPAENEAPVYMAAIYKDRSVDRYSGNVNISYNQSENLNLISGFQFYQDIAQDHLDDEDRVFWNEKKKISYNNIGVYAQALIKSKIANVTIGARMDYHSQFGEAFAPRIAITKVVDGLHAKLLFSQAYRSPGIENIDLSAYLNPPEYEPNIKPEKMNVAELEIGKRFAQNMFVSLNTFYMKLNDPIVYYFDEFGNEGYKNVEQTGTYGCEVQYQWKENWGFINTNYSFYSAKGINKTPDFETEENGTALLAAPQHKFTFTGSVNITKKMSVTPSFVILGKRYGYKRYDPENDNMELVSFDPVFMANIYLNYRNLLVDGLNVGIGIFDMLKSDYSYIQPYNGWHAPLPAPSREIVFRLSYHLNYEK